MFSSQRYLASTIVSISLLGFGAACSKGRKPGQNAPGETGLIIPNNPLPVPKPGETTVEWPNGSVSRVVEYKGQTYVKVQGLVAPDTYALRIKDGNPLTEADVKKDIENDLRRSIAKLQTIAGQRFLSPKIVGETGYYSLWIPYNTELWTRLHSVNDLPIPLTLEVVKYDPTVMSRIQAQSDRLYAAVKKQGLPTDGLSGLRSIGVTNEFLAQVEGELGQRPTGTNVKIGITDSGITYNHPAFLDHEGKSRIRFIKDGTPQGKIYFPSTNTLKLRLPTAAELESSKIAQANLVVVESGSVHFAPESELPAGDGSFLQNLAPHTLLNVPAEVKAAVEAGDGVQVGLLAENSFVDDRDGKVYDLNANKKFDDIYGVLLVAPKSAAQADGSVDTATYKAYVSMDAVGTYDGSKLTLNKLFSFAKTKGLHDFNQSGETQQSFAERFGVTIKPTELVSESSDATIGALEVALVGYTAGGGNSHGSHVAGIAAGYATLQNDSELTLARGVAPEANIYFYRVCGASIGCGYYEEAIQELAFVQKVDVINMSLGGSREENSGYDTSSLLIDRITQLSGTTFVISAGNEGTGLQTHGSPSTARLALSVAASASRSMLEIQNQVSVPGVNDNDNDDDFVLPFSSRGPLSNGSFKPNITAPGTELSSVAFNVSKGRAGSDIMQGTSMASPTVAGAYALLLDIARIYNSKNPSTPVPTDYQSMRKAIIGSARAFDVTTFDLQTQVAKKGHYTWVDQGVGMMNVPGAWEALKGLAASQLPTGIALNSVRVEPDYQVRSAVTSRYGKLYDGTPLLAEDGSPTGPGQWGGGLWIDNRAFRTLHTIGIARRVPTGSPAVQSENDAGEAFRQLASSTESFILKTEMHGSDIPWLKVNTLFNFNTGDGNTCDAVETRERLILNGQGALDAVGGAGVAGVPESTLFVCVDRSKVATLPPGDHGALIRAYRTNAEGTRIENVPAFVIPVYLNIPHETLTDSKPYTIVEGKVKAFETARNYVFVPAGLTALKVTLSVPRGTKDVFGQPKNCSGVTMDVYSASAVNRLPEFDPSAVFVNARSCTGPGGAVLDTDPVSFVREIALPKAGLWEFHVNGFDYYGNSTYNLRVDYVKAAAKVTEVVSTKDGLKAGFFNLEIQESSTRGLTVDPAKSRLVLNKAQRKSAERIVVGDDLTIIPNAEGKNLRIYPNTVSALTLTTSKAPVGSNVELALQECEVNGAACQFAAVSLNGNSDESITYTLRPNKAYQVIVIDEAASASKPVPFELTEILTLKAAAVGAITPRTLGSDQFWEIAYALDPASTANAAFFNSPIFANKKYEAVGAITVSSADITIATVPVRVTF